MKQPQIIEQVIYGLIVILSLVVLWLVANAPDGILNAHVVYQGF